MGWRKRTEGASALAASPPLSREQELWLCLCAFAAAAPHAYRAPLWLVGVCGVLYAARALLWWRRQALPSRWVLTALALAAGAGVLVEFRNLFGRDPGTALLLLLLALKLMEARSVRDAFGVAFMAYFLQLALFFYSQTFFSAVMALVISVGITATLIKHTHPAASAASALRLSGAMMVHATPFMLLLFVLFPRVQGPLWSLPADAYGGLSGLSEDMSPGSISELSLSDAIAFRAEFAGDSLPRSRLYWRGPVLTRFDGRTWHALPATTSQRLPYLPKGIASEYSVTLEPHNKTWMFALELPGTIPEGASISSDFRLLAAAPLHSRTRYDLVSFPTAVAGEHERLQLLRMATQLPTGSNPRTRALAAELRGQAEDDQDMVKRTLEHFRQQRFTYTLRPPLLGEHSVDEFLFETKQGFCEHFASSFAFMMRAAGIPARVVTGYQGGEMNPVGGYLIVRQSDAHAWAEVWLQGVGWQRVDPTAASAPARIQSGLMGAVPNTDALPLLVRMDLGWLRTMRFQWDALANTWNQWVLGYNAVRQREVLQRLGMRAPDWQSMTMTLAATVGALMIVLTLYALRKRIQRDPVQRAWERLCEKLGRVGLARRSWEGPLDYAQRVADARPNLAENMTEIAQLYIRLRYARPAEGDSPRLLADKIKAIRQ